jgi:hypothetical protein
MMPTAKRLYQWSTSLNQWPTPLCIALMILGFILLVAAGSPDVGAYLVERKDGMLRSWLRPLQ